MKIFIAALALVMLVGTSVFTFDVVNNGKGQSVSVACGKAGPSCRRCYPNVYTAQCPK
jgi:hypothetical protein